MNYRAILLAVLFISIILTGCNSSNNDDDPTTDPNRVQQAQTALAGVTPTATTRPTATPRPAVEQEISRTVARMANAVLAGDVDRYFELVSPVDPTFEEEHRAWANFWVNEPFEEFHLTLRSVQVESDTEALGRLVMSWRRSDRSGVVGINGANITVRFIKPDPDTDMWLFAGEAWESVGVYWDGTNWHNVWENETPPENAEERIRVYYFPDIGPVEGTRDATENMLQDLPGVYNRVADELDFSPDDPIYIKLYDIPDNLRAMTSIAMLPDTLFFTAPDQSVKLVVQPNTDSLPPDIITLSNTLTEAFLYRMASGQSIEPSIMGAVLNLVTGNLYQTLTWRNNQIENLLRELPEDEALDPEDSPLLMSPGSPLTLHVLMLYLDDVYGEDARNDWIKKVLVDGITIEEALETTLDASFEEINEAFLLWLGEQWGRIS